MSNVDKRYYKIHISGHDHIFTNVEKADNYYVVDNVTPDGRVTYASTLSLEEIETAKIYDSMKFTDSPLDYVFKAYIVNSSEYDNGNKETSGTWLYFPPSELDVKSALAEIGLSPDCSSDKYFFDSFKSEIKSIENLLPMHTSIEQLTDLSRRLSELDRYEIVILNAVMESGAKFENIEQLREYTFNPAYFNLVFDVSSEAEIGISRIYHSGEFDNFEDFEKDAINAAAFGKYFAEATQGTFTAQGFLYKTSYEWRSVSLPDFIPNAVRGGADERLIDTTEIFAVDLDSFFRETSDEYSNMFDDVVKAQKHIADYIRTNNTAQVKQIIHGMKKEHHLSEDEIQPYLDRLDNFDKNKGIEKDYNFIAVITNAEDYLKGDFESVKIYLPTDKETVSRAFEEIGLLPHAVQGEYMFDDFHLYSEKLHSVIKPTESLDELNYFSALVFRMDDGMCDRFMNEIEKDKNIKNLTDLINHANKTLGLAARYNGDKSTIPAEYRVTMEPASIKRSIKKQLEENKGKTADVPAAQAKNKKNDLEV